MDKNIFAVQILAALMISAALVVGGAPHDLPSVVLEGEPGSPSTGDVKWIPAPKVNNWLACFKRYADLICLRFCYVLCRILTAKRRKERQNAAG